MQAESGGHRLRAMMHAQHLSGVGHFVRSLEIARAIAVNHEVVLTDGGRQIPRPWPENVERLGLPRIHRAGDGLSALDGAGPVPDIMAERSRLLAEKAASFRPDVLTVEHYPFSKWELDAEVGALIAAARRANPAVRVICSVRDIPRQTRNETCSAEEYAEAVLRRLHEYFDAVLVHGDEALTPLAAHFPGTSEICLPVFYTGLVSEKPAASAQTLGEIRRITNGRPFVMASVGGGRDAAGLLENCLKAWDGLRTKNALPGHAFVVFTGLTGAMAKLERAAEHDDSVHLLPFSRDFLGWMQHAQLSISCAGYNTCANVLETHCRALLIPNPEMSDQALRAELLARLGAAQILSAGNLDPDSLGDAMLAAMARIPARPRMDLDGASHSREIIERFVLG